MEAGTHTPRHLPKMTYYFISGNLPDEYGGLTKSLLLRSKLFGELQETPTHFLTFGFDLHFKAKEERLYREKRIHPDYTSLINLYDSYLSDVSKGKRTYSEKIDLSKLINLKNQNGFIKKVSQFFGSPDIEFELSYYEEDEKVQFVYFPKELKREEYRHDGTLATVSYFNSNADHPYLIEYVNKDQLIYADKTFTYDAEKGEHTLSSINWYSDQGLLSFKKETEIRQHWIQTIQKISNEPKLFLIDSRPQDRHIFNVPKEQNTYYATLIHSKHYGKSKLALKNRFKELMGNRLEIDAVFLLTKEQITDIQILTGPQKNFFYTPHTLGRNLDESVLESERSAHKAVIISRLTSSKNMTDSIKAFAKVVEEIPEATLDIYGSGDEEQTILNLIHELNMIQNIFLKGYTTNPDIEFQTATLTLCTSNFEGFGLSNMEALSNGCPVVTYDYDYGARTLVQNGENGYIVNQGDIKELSTKMIEIMQNNDLRQSLSEKAFQSAKGFTPETFVDHWATSLYQMKSYRETKQKLYTTYKDCSFSLANLEVHATNEIHSVIQSDLLNQEYLSLSLVGLDRKHKIELFRTTLEASNTSNEYVGMNSDLKVESIQPNEINTIDFYVEIRDAAGVTIHKRLVSEIDHHENFSICPTFKMETYQTKFNNYSWKIKR